MPGNLRSKLDADISATLARLRVVAPDDTQYLIDLLAARDGLIRVVDAQTSSPKNLPYVYYDSVIEAILDWLKVRGFPATDDEIVKGVLDGGLQLHSPRRELNVRDSIRFHTSPKNEKAARLRRKGRLIGPR
jgi:hypothetical protein